MFTSAPRLPARNLTLSLLLLVTFWLSPGCGDAAHASFHFKDFGTHPKLATPDSIQAVSAELLDAQTGEVLFARNPDQRLLPASTTKLMTALIVYEKLGGMHGSVTVVDDDRAEPSNIPVVPGETISVDTLFHALLIESANDSARVLGRSVAGSTEAFVGMMNQKALALGCFNTHFHNPNGLPAPAGTHFTSCADLMKIFVQVLKYPELAEILRTKYYQIRTESGVHELRNHNLLLGRDPRVGSAKTGWTVASRHTYACEASANGHTLLLTLLDSPDKWHDAEILFNWGFTRESSGGVANNTSGP
jgi:D-alanyl-D-alanine carboxypeptidase